MGGTCGFGGRRDDKKTGRRAIGPCFREAPGGATLSSRRPVVSSSFPRRAGSGGGLPRRAVGACAALESGLVSQKIVQRVDAADAVAVGRKVFVEREEGLGMVVANREQGRVFALARRGVAHSFGDLPVVDAVAAARHEVHFPAVLPPDEDVRKATEEFEKDHVFEDAPGVAVPVAGKPVPESDVRRVVLASSRQDFLSADVVAFGLAEEKGVAEGVDIALYRVAVRLEPSGRKAVRDVSEARRIPDVVEKEPGDAVDQAGVGELLAAEDVLDENRVVDAVQIVSDEPGVAIKGKNVGEGAEAEILGVASRPVARGAYGVAPFPERERLHRDFDVAPGKMRGKFAGEHVGIGARDVDIDSPSGVEAVDQLLEFRDPLYFVQKHVGRPPLSEPQLDPVPDRAPRSEIRRVRILEIERNDLFRGDARTEKFVPEQFKNRRLSATANAGDDLDDVAVAPLAQVFDVGRTGNEVFHGKTPVFSAGDIQAEAAVLVNGNAKSIYHTGQNIGILLNGSSTFAKSCHASPRPDERTKRRKDRASSPVGGRGATFCPWVVSSFCRQADFLGVASSGGGPRQTDDIDNPRRKAHHGLRDSVRKAAGRIPDASFPEGLGCEGRRYRRTSGAGMAEARLPPNSTDNT